MGPWCAIGRLASNGPHQLQSEHIQQKNRKTGKKGKIAAKKIDEMISEIYISVGRLNKQITKFRMDQRQQPSSAAPCASFF